MSIFFDNFFLPCILSSMTLGEQLEKLRSQVGLSQAELARRVGISPQLLSAYLNDKVRSPRYETAKRLAAELGCDVDTILSGGGK